MADLKFNVNCGFFDSINNDRVYSADEMNRPYKRIITNGVFATPQGTPSTDLQVLSANNGLNIIVKKGEGLFGDKWFENPSDLIITVPTNSDIVPRIDSVIAQVDKTQNGREGNLIYRTGTPSSNPSVPAINTDSRVIEYRIANIRVGAAATSISQANITDLRGSSECLWITSLIKQVDTSVLFAQYRDAYNTYYEEATRDFDEYKQTEKTAFDAFMESLTEQLTVNTNLVKYESHFVSTGTSTTTIPINIAPFNKDKDILMVRVNHLFASEDVDYVIDSNSQITLTKDIKANQNVDFLVLQSVVVGDTETVLQEVQRVSNELTHVNNVLDKTQVVSDDGTVKISMSGSSQSVLEAFVSAGVGFHTMYAPTGTAGNPVSAGAFRYFGHLTGADNGWIMALQGNGSVYANYYNSGSWQGWKTLYENTPEPLWVGSSFMNASATITPSKKLSECRNGWILVWSDYDDATKTKNKYNEVTFCVPKRNVDGDSRTGSSFMCMLPVLVREDGTFEYTIKQVYIYNDKITGHAPNATGVNNRGVVLGAVYEY